jgi:hypothetical protein
MNHDFKTGLFSSPTAKTETTIAAAIPLSRKFNTTAIRNTNPVAAELSWSVYARAVISPSTIQPRNAGINDFRKPVHP